MALVRIGCKRLYNSPGCSLDVENDFESSFQIAKMEARVSIGCNPKLGISATGGTKYVVPGQKAPFQTLTFGREDASKLKHIELVTEITCCEMVEAQDKQVQAFHAGDAAATEELLDMVQGRADSFRQAIDLIAGTIGLRFHRQFVQEVLAESPVVFKDNNIPTQRYHGPVVELLENLTLNKVGAASLGETLRLIGIAQPETQEFGASVLAWLLRAWSENDSFSKFMSLFIPIELVLSSEIRCCRTC